MVSGACVANNMAGGNKRVFSFEKYWWNSGTYYFYNKLQLRLSIR
jgi:hypothetical protein